MKLLEKVTNIAILVTVAVFLTVTVRSQLHKRDLVVPESGPQSGTSGKSLVGKNISLPTLPYPLKAKTLVMFLSTTCHFCKASEPFYRQLALRATGKVDLIAVLPQPQDQATEYLKSGEVSANKVISMNLTSVGINATPTLLLPGATGKVEQVEVL